MYQAQGFTMLISDVMRVVQAFADLSRNEHCQLTWKVLALTLQSIEHSSQVFAANVLHGDEVGIPHLAKIIDLDNILMMKEHRCLGLLNQHINEFTVFAKAGQDSLDDDLLLETTNPLEFRQEDFGHSSLGHFPDEVIASERLDLAQVWLPKSVCDRSRRLTSLAADVPVTGFARSFEGLLAGNRVQLGELTAMSLATIQSEVNPFPVS